MQKEILCCPVETATTSRENQANCSLDTLAYCFESNSTSVGTKTTPFPREKTNNYSAILKEELNYHLSYLYFTFTCSSDITIPALPDVR